MNSILRFAVHFRWMIIFLTAILAGVGAWQLNLLPIDVTPDITNKQVQINTVIPTLTPVEVEKRVTYPIETAIAGLNGVENFRSFSRNGFSQVTVIFKESANLYFMRQQIAERLTLARANLPAGAEPIMGPVSTGLGEVFHYSVEFEFPDGKNALKVDGKPGWQTDGSFLTDEGQRLYDRISQLAYLRTVQDWIIRPQLRTTAGVADVDSLGGYVKQYVVEPEPNKLAVYGISIKELGQALEENNTSAGGNYIQRSGESYLVRADGRIKTIEEISHAVVTTRQGVPISVGQLAKVSIGGELRTGAASRNGYETVVGSALMLVGANSRTVAGAVGDKLKEIGQTLPPGIIVVPALDRSQLVIATITTVAKNLAEGGVFALALRDIPFSISAAVGFIAVSGVAVLNGLVLISAIKKRTDAGMQAEAAVAEGSMERVRPVMMTALVAILGFIPMAIATGTGAEVQKPLATVVIGGLMTATALTLFVLPALTTLLLKKRS
eukprot:XP_015584128.1 uncharacterized protein LOC8272793 [Ricinus communis]